MSTSQPNNPDDLHRQSCAEILLWIIPLIWSSNYVIARVAGGLIPPNSLAFGRWLIALLLMLPFVWKSRRDLLKHGKLEWKQCLILGALGMWICGAFVYIAGETTTAANISLIYAAAPVGIAVASSFILGEKLSILRQLALACALLGVLFIVSKGHLSSLLNVQFVPGDIWVLMATAAWVAYSILQQRWSTKLLPMQRLVCISAGGLLVLFPFALLEVQGQSLAWISTKTLGIVLAAGIFPGLLSYLAYSYMVQQLGANRAGLVLYLGPVYTAVVGWLFLGEIPQWFHLVGAFLVLPSIYLAKATLSEDRSSSP